jgi:hypothetical protein
VCFWPIIKKDIKKHITVTVTKLHASEAVEALLSTYSVAVSHQYRILSFAAL